MRKKVLHVITRLDKGGSAINTLATCVGLVERGYEVDLVTGLSLESDMSAPERKATEDSLVHAEKKGVRVQIFPKLVRRVHPWHDLAVLFQLFSLIKKESYSIVHTHTSKAGILGRWAAFLARTPIIIHTPHGHVFSGYFGPWKTKFFLLLEKISSLMSDTIITLTDQCLEEHVMFNVAPREKFRTIHSGVPLGQFWNSFAEGGEKIRNRLGLVPELLVVGSIGRLVPVKGYDLFLRVAAIIKKLEPKVFFLIMGEGPMRAELLSMAEKLGLSKSLALPGWQPDPENWLRAMDVFLLTSRNEGMGRVLVEAMACGKPVVATMVGGVPGVVQSGVTGFLAPAENPGALANEVLKLLRDPESRRALGEAGRKRSKEFGVEAMIEKINGLYEERIRVKMESGQHREQESGDRGQKNQVGKA